MKITIEQIKDVISFLEDNNLQIKCDICGSTNYDFVEIEHTPLLTEFNGKYSLPLESKIVSLVKTICKECGDTTWTKCSDPK